MRNSVFAAQLPLESQGLPGQEYSRSPLALLGPDLNWKSAPLRLARRPLCLRCIVITSFIGCRSQHAVSLPVSGNTVGAVGCSSRSVASLRSAVCLSFELTMLYRSKMVRFYGRSAPWRRARDAGADEVADRGTAVSWTRVLPKPALAQDDRGHKRIPGSRQVYGQGIPGTGTHRPLLSLRCRTSRS